MLWAAVCTAFYGLLRSCEFLAPTSDTTEIGRILLWSSVKTTSNTVVIQLHRTKTAQPGDGGTAELLPTGDSACPVVAMRTFQATCVPTLLAAESPVFKYVSGKFLTRSELSDMLRFALSKQSVSSHSLRIGGATYLAARGAGEWEIKRAGRWRSNAYERYVRRSGGIPRLSA